MVITKQCNLSLAAAQRKVFSKANEDYTSLGWDEKTLIKPGENLIAFGSKKYLIVEKGYGITAVKTMDDGKISVKCDHLQADHVTVHKLVNAFYLDIHFPDNSVEQHMILPSPKHAQNVLHANLTEVVQHYNDANPDNKMPEVFSTFTEAALTAQAKKENSPFKYPAKYNTSFGIKIDADGHVIAPTAPVVDAIEELFLATEGASAEASPALVGDEATKTHHTDRPE